MTTQGLSPREAQPRGEEVYEVVVNDEEQYSIWIAAHEVPTGWHRVGVSGPRSECLDYIEKTWTDIRPLSLRRRLQGLRVDPPQ